MEVLFAHPWLAEWLHVDGFRNQNSRSALLPDHPNAVVSTQGNAAASHTLPRVPTVELNQRSGCSQPAGSSIQKVLPWPTSESNPTLPFIRSTARFTIASPQKWYETERIEHPPDARHAYAMTFVTLERIGDKRDSIRAPA